MDARLRKFYFASLNAAPLADVQQSFRENAMDDGGSHWEW